jgi:hypothetical protein
MKSIERASFASVMEFCEYAWKAGRLAYYHVFDGMPDQHMIDALADCGPDEALVLLDVSEDRGLLKQTNVTVDIMSDHEFVTRKMAERPGLGGWAKGAFLEFVTDPSDVPRLIEYSRRVAFPPQSFSESAISLPPAGGRTIGVDTAYPGSKHGIAAAS